MSFAEFVSGLLLGALFIHQGRRIARSPERTLDPSAPWHIRSRIAGFVPVRASSVRLMRGVGIVTITLGLTLILGVIASGFQPSTAVRIAIVVLAAIITFFLTPGVPKGPRSPRSFAVAPYRASLLKPGASG